MRILLFLLLLTSQVAFATDNELAKKLSALTPQQQKVLYQYGTLQNYAGKAIADSFWQQHHQEVALVTQEEAGVLAGELLANTDLVYTEKRPSRLQALRGVFTASRMLAGLAALIAAYSLIHLLGRHWSRISAWLIRVFGPLFRRLFSPQMLTWELLLLGIAGIYAGPLVPETVLRTIILHLGLFTVWAQLTAIATRKYLINQYIDEITDCLENRRTPGQILLHAGLPALCVTGATIWLMYRLPDPWYAYEVVLPGLIALYTLPPLTLLRNLFTRLLLPFRDEFMKSDKRLIAYVAITLLAWIALVLLPPAQPPVLIALSMVLAFQLPYFSIADITRCGTKNYIWLQLVTVGWLCACILAGGQLNILLLNWTGLGGLLIYVVIKYWEIPVLLGYSWKNRKAWGALGMALIIWGIASLIRWQPQWFVWF